MPETLQVSGRFTGGVLVITATLGAFSAQPILPVRLHGAQVSQSPLTLTVEWPSAAVRARFNRLALKWKQETEFTSCFTDLIGHPAYLQIIGMGRDAVPLIIDELRREPHHWFAALSAITGDDPIREEDAGNLRQMTAAWLAWADRRS